jgi:hypothetical protein
MDAATASATAPVTLAGLGLYLAGLAFVIAGMSAASLGLFLAGTVVGGLAVGALFIGSLSTANGLAPAENHAQVLSTFFVFAYSGLIIPVVGVGTAADYVGDFPAVLGNSIALGALCVFSAVVISGSGRAAPIEGPAAGEMTAITRTAADGSRLPLALRRSP